MTVDVIPTDIPAIMTRFGWMRWYRVTENMWRLDLVDESYGNDFCAQVVATNIDPYITVYKISDDDDRRTVVRGKQESLPSGTSIEAMLAVVVTRLIEYGIVDPVVWVSQCVE